MPSKLQKYRNMGLIDRATRTLVGFSCLYVGFGNPSLLNDGLLNLLVGVFGLTNLVSAYLRVCPGYLLANFSTDGGNAECRNNNNNSSEVDTLSDLTIAERSLEDTGWFSIKVKLFLSVAVPMLILLALFGRGYFNVLHQLEMREVSAQTSFPSELALKLHNRQADGGTVSAQEIELFEDSMKSTDILVLHTLNGLKIETPFDNSATNPGLNQHLINEIENGIRETGKHSQGMTMYSGVSYIWSSIPSKENDLWATAICPTPSAHTALGMLFSPKLIVILLGFIWLSIWSSTYIIKKFVDKTTDSTKRLKHQMVHDTLTGLPNMMKYEHIMSERLEAGEKKETGIAVLLLDLAGFRDVNDTLGYKMGDVLLKQVADDLQEQVLPDGNVLRVGSDVFCIVCATSLDRSESTMLANKVHDSIELHKELNNVPIAVHGKIGISCYPLDSSDPSELVRLADIALAQAKHAQVKTCHYQFENDTHSVRKLSLLARLRGAIENNEMTLVYQPKVNIQTNEVVGVEALVRWVDHEYGAVSPIEFVTWAEKSGLIDKLTHWVLRTAEQQNKEWMSRGIQLPIAVNLSPLNLHDSQLVPLIHELTVGGSFARGQLELELTENAVMCDPATALKTMTTLNGMGVRFSIDDFGTGLSSFSYLRKFPISHLKIDRIFIVDPDHDDRDAVLLKSMINLGHSLECVVTAEGVEDQKTLDKLVEHGCDYVQGYHVCKPIPADELAAWYAKSDWNRHTRAA